MGLHLDGPEKRTVSYGPVPGDLRCRARGLSSGTVAVEMATDDGRGNSATRRGIFAVSPGG